MFKGIKKKISDYFFVKIPDTIREIQDIMPRRNSVKMCVPMLEDPMWVYEAVSRRLLVATHLESRSYANDGETFLTLFSEYDAMRRAYCFPFLYEIRSMMLRFVRASREANNAGFYAFNNALQDPDMRVITGSETVDDLFGKRNTKEDAEIGLKKVKGICYPMGRYAEKMFKLISKCNFVVKEKLSEGIRKEYHDTYVSYVGSVGERSATYVNTVNVNSEITDNTGNFKLKLFAYDFGSSDKVKDRTASAQTIYNSVNWNETKVYFRVASSVNADKKIVESISGVDEHISDVHVVSDSVVEIIGCYISEEDVSIEGKYITINIGNKINDVISKSNYASYKNRCEEIRDGATMSWTDTASWNEEGDITWNPGVSVGEQVGYNTRCEVKISKAYIAIAFAEDICCEEVK